MDIFADLEKDIEKQESKTLDLGPITKLVSRQVALEEKPHPGFVQGLVSYIRENRLSIGDIEEALKIIKSELNWIRTKGIPEYLVEWGIDGLETEEGHKLKLKTGLSITIKDHDRFYRFVREQNHGDIIKDVVTVEDPDDIINLLVDHEKRFERKESIHGNTLKKFIRICLEKGIDVPQELVNIYEYRYAQIKRGA